jgi:hypothetical protein
MPNEADRKRELVKAVRAIGGQARRIEDSWAVGVLDLIIKLPGVPLVFAEGKIIKSNLFGPTLAQFAEGEKWIKAGVEAVLIGWQDSAMYISQWVKQADKRDCWVSGKGSDADSLLEYLKVQNGC